MAKPFDRAYKVFGQDDVRGLLHLAGELPLDEPAEIEPIDKDLSLPGLIVDDCFIIRRQDRVYALHLECEHHWHAGIPRDTARYVMSLDLKLEMPVHSVLVLLTSTAYPKTPPCPYRLSRGSLTVEVDYRLVPLWQQDPAAILQLGRLSLMPWLMLMKPDPAQVQRASRSVAESGNRELAAQFLSLGRLNRNYDTVELLELMGRNGMLLKDEILEQSDFVQYFKNKGIEVGLEKGLEKGREERRQAAVVLVKKVVAGRFPGLEVPESLALASAPELDLIVENLSMAPDRQAAETILSRQDPGPQRQ